MAKPLVFLCMPSHDERVDGRALDSFYAATLGMCNVCFQDGPERGSPTRAMASLLDWNFNKLWCMALNMRGKFNITHFAMLHADIQAEPGWLDKLVCEQQGLMADVVSTVVPFKRPPVGITSTGLGDPKAPRENAGTSGDCRRLTLKEVYRLPETFCSADADALQDGTLGYEKGRVLLPNTGCWVCDFKKPWVDVKNANGRRVFKFSSYHDITEDTTGQCHAETRGEDFNAGFLWHDLGAKVYATRKVKAVHWGDHGYSNWPDWGEWETDRSYKALMELRAKA